MGKSSYREKSREKRLAGQVSLALAAGMFSVAPVAHGMPTVDTSPGAHADYTTKPVAVGDTMEVQGNRTNNVIDWKDFSIENGKTVAFQDVGGKAANYMNIVTGHATSNIEGTMTNNGDIYLINPNGVIFGATAQVNVGNLYVSTREASQVAIDTFRGVTATGPSNDGTILAATLMDNALKADVVNLIDNEGYVKADKVVMEGRNIRFLNASSAAKKDKVTVNPDQSETITPYITETDGKYSLVEGGNSNLILRSNTDGYIHVGDEEKNYNYTAQTITASATQNARKFNNASGVNYALIHDAADIGKINNNTFHNPTDTTENEDLTGNYMLAKDIKNAGNVQIGTATAAGVGNAFTGKFDGMFFTVSGLSQADNTKYLGLFGHTNGARIENVGVKEAQLTGMYAGGIVGYAENSTTILNVWNEGGDDTYIGPAVFGNFTGGLVGTLKSSTLDNSYNAGAVHGAGLVSQLTGTSTIKNSYNIGETAVTGGGIYGTIRRAESSNDKIINSYSAAQYLHGTAGTEMWDNTATYTNSYIITSENSYKANKETTNIASYTLTKDLYSTWSIDSEGGKNTTWRIYEGASLPLLTSFMKAKGTVSMEYDYKGDNGAASSTVGKSGTYNTTSGTIPLPSKTYDAKGVYNTLSYTADNTNGKYVLDTDGQTYRRATAEELANNQIQKYKENYILTPTYYGMNVKADKVGVTQNNRKDVYVGSGTTATKFALFYGGQQGYDLYGNNFTIEKRSLAFSSSTAPTFTKVYDGSPDATDALINALSHATSGTTGFLEEDRQYVDAGHIAISVTGLEATYDTKNVGSNKTVTVSDDGSGDAPAVSLALVPGDAHKPYQYIVDNYDVTESDLSDLIDQSFDTGVITARPVLVDLTTKNGIDKVYDGTSDVTKDGCVGAANLTASAIAGNSNSGLVAGDNATLSATSVYVDANGNATKNVAGTTGAVKVAYKNIVATDEDGNTGNYAFYYKVGENLVAVNASPLTAGGSITPRTLSKDYLVLKDAQGNELGAIEKEYDGTKTKALTGTTAAYASAQIIDNTTTPTAGQGSTTGLLATDAANMTFTSTGTATFYKADGTTETSFASDNGGANRVGYGVGITTTDASILTNYQWSDAAGTALATTVNKIGAANSGVINKRDVTVALKWDSGIDKVYDGNENVKDVTGGNAYKTGNYEITSGTLVVDATTSSTPTIGISGTPTYSDKNVEYEADGVTPKAKSIAYTIAITGDAAGNYNLNSTNSATVELAATGTITPRELSLTFGSADKTYDGDALVHTIPTVTINNLVTGDSADDVLDTAKIAGRYGSDATGTFVTSANVGNYTTEAATAGAKVLYTGLKNNDGTYKDIKTAIKDTIKGKNYTISNTVYGKGIISKKTISTTDLDTATSVKNGYTPLTKVYDGSPTDSSTAVTGLSWSDYLVWNDDQTVFAPTDRDNLTITIAEAIYTNKNVNDPESPQAVSLKYNIKGTAAANYEFVGDTVTTNADGSKTIAYTKAGYTGTITPRTVTVTMKDGVTSPTKIYDGTTTVKATGVTTTAGVSTLNNGTWSNWFQLANVVDGEDLQLANGITAAYASEDVAYDNTGAVTTQAVNYGNVALADGTSALASNYTLVNDIQGVGTINKRNVTLSDYGVATATKTYDGDAEVEAYALTFADVTQEGATDKSVLYADGITDASGKIVSNLSGTYLPTGSQTQGQGKDVLRASTNRATILEKDVEYTGTALTNLYGGNYNVTLANGGTYNSTTGKLTVTGGGKINPAQIQVNGGEIVAAAANRVYDGTKSLENPAIDYLTFNNAELNAHRNDLTVTGTYDSKNAGARNVTYTISMDANNYDLSGDIYDAVTGTATKMGSGTISKKTIYGVVGATASTQKSTISKVYDGYTTVEGADATTAKTWLTTNLAADGTGAVAITDEDGDLDDVSILTTGVTLAYKDANVATSDANDKVTYSGLALTGTDADNYTLGNTKDAEDKYVAYGYGTITPKSIAFAITVADGAYKKDYDEKTGLRRHDDVWQRF